MIPLRLVEKDHDNFNEPVVELWRDNEFVGHVFWDEDVPVVQVFPGDGGEPHDLDLRDLVRILDLADQIVSPDAFSPDELEDLRSRISEAGASPTGEDQVERLATEFDNRVVHRSPDGEGFFPRSVAFEFVGRCDELDIAVVEMEGFDLEDSRLVARPNLNLMVRGTPGDGWVLFRPDANLRAAKTLGDWPDRSSLVVSFVVQLADGESVVM